MSKKTIAKICCFVIFSCGVIACSGGPKGPKIDAANSAYGPPKIVGRIESDDVKESSGLAASACQPNVFWTHNDSGDGPYVYAMDAGGKNLGVWNVTDAKNEDWEDIDAIKTPSGECYLYIGEIGNTNKLERTQQTIYRIKEPIVANEQAGLTKKDAASTAPAEKIDLRYADGNKDSETLLVRPENGDIYILTKTKSGPSAVYRLASTFGSGEFVTVSKVADLSVPSIPNGLLTGGAISPDGKRIVLCDYSAAYELTLPDGAASFDDIWRQTPVAVDLGSRKQGEAISYSADGKAIFATSEGKGSPMIEVVRK